MKIKLSDLARKIITRHIDFSTRFPEATLLGYCSNEIAGESLSRYIFASKLVRGMILNCASGSCYGSSILRRNDAAKLVLSVDIDRDFLAYGKLVYDADCVCADAMNMPFREHCFDSIVSLETLEHIKDEKTFLTNIKTCLKCGGNLVISTPNKVYTSPFALKPLNPYHVKEYYFGSLLKLLRSHGFVVCVAYGGKKVSTLELIRKVFSFLLKFLLTKLLIKPYIVDVLYGSIGKLIIQEKKIPLIDSNPRLFAHEKIKTFTNLTLYQYFLIHTVSQTCMHEGEVD